MKLTKTLSAIAVVAILTTPSIASATEVVGELTSVNGEVLIERAGEFLRATENSALLAGDRVITSDNAFATVKLNECTNSLPATSSVSLGASDYCSNIMRVAELGVGETFGNASMNIAPESASYLPLLGFGVVAATALLVDGGKDDDDIAASP